MTPGFCLIFFRLSLFCNIIPLHDNWHATEDMVSRKRLDYGFNGYRAPVIPRAPRSIRRGGPLTDFYKDSKLCAFELRAAVAGKLLRESESSASSNIAGAKNKTVIFGNVKEKGRLIIMSEGQLIDDKSLKSNSFGHGDCAESAFVPEISIQEQNLLPSSKERPQSEFGPSSECTSELMISNVLEKVDCENICGGSTCFGDSFNLKVETQQQVDPEDENCQIKQFLAKTSNVKEPSEECVNSNMIINLDSSVQLPMYRGRVADACLQKQSTDVNIGIRDDDENSFRCKKLSAMVGPFKPHSRTEHRRIRKMMTSKYKKVASKRKGYEPYISEGMKLFYQSKKRRYTREGYQQVPIKKRKLSDNRLSVAYDQDSICDSISNFPEKGNKIANGTVKVHSEGRDPHAVIFSIKSFKVPELYIEVPETASVGYLKRTVMESITAILGSGVRVGVLLHGKKVRDDSRTLQQAGISQSNDLDTLDFTLEPCFTHISSSKAAVNQPSQVLKYAENPELARSPATTIIDSAISNASMDPLAAPVSTQPHVDDVENNGLISSSPELPTNEVVGGAAVAFTDPSKALVALMDVGPLAVVPVDSKPKRSELSQRRIRRPFSVVEVEALVGAVEKLGTGRWRDIKIGAFENTDHRTYVHLKDKWKTLVHTASISPHQRRGEPVPQELLDRVLVAHTYWSHQNGKHLAVEPLNPHEEIARALCS